MATIRKIRNKYQAIIRKGKYKGKPLTKTFTKKGLALAWANKIETEIEQGAFHDERSTNTVLFNDLVNKYYSEYVSTLSENTQKVENYRKNAICNYFSKKTLNQVDNELIYQYGKFRLKTIKADAMIKDLTMLSGVYRFCIDVWDIPVKQNEAKVARSRLQSSGLMNSANKQRVNRVTNEDYEKIRRYQSANGSVIKYLALFAIETGMRRSELANMEWRDIDLAHSVYFLPKEKSDNKKKTNTKGRIVPLTFRAKAVLRLLRLSNKGDRVWPWQDVNSLTRENRKMLDRLGIKHIRLHDYRHEFGSTQADNDVDIRISASAMGHSDLRSVARYSHPDMIKNASKIKGRR